MKHHILNPILAAVAVSLLGWEARAQDRRLYSDSRYDRVDSRDDHRDRMADEVRALNSRLARVRADLRAYGGNRQMRRQFAHVERQVDYLNDQFRSGRYDRGHVRRQLAELDDDLRQLSADLRGRAERSGYASRDERSGYLEYHPTTLQRALASRGYYRGPIDGEIGPGTSRAIVRFQIDRGLSGTGRVDSQLLRMLGIN
jgi:hypothetical protein